MLSKISQTALRLPREFSRVTWSRDFNRKWCARTSKSSIHSILIWTRTTSETATVLWSPLIPYSSSWVPQGPLLGCKQTNRNRTRLGPNITFWWREVFAYIRLKLFVVCSFTACRWIYFLLLQLSNGVQTSLFVILAFLFLWSYIMYCF